MWRWITDPDRWAQEYFGSAELGDKRLTERLVDYTGRQANLPGGSTNRVCRVDEAAREGAFRMLRNSKVTHQGIAQAGFAMTQTLCEGREDVVVAEDSTTLNYTHDVANELGTVGGKAGCTTRGFIAHSALALDAQSGEILGLLDQVLWTRPAKAETTKKRGRRHDRYKSVPYKDKESYKWQRSSENVGGRIEDTRKFIWVCDRESDIHEYLQYKITKKERFVVRATENRAVDSPHRYLWEHMKAQPVVGTREVAIAQRGRLRGEKPRPARQARQATLEIRYATVTLTPKDPRHKDRRSITLQAVLVNEPNPPEGVEPLEWMLLTKEELNSSEDAERVIKYYELRWNVEEFHKAWKTGCRAEQRRMRTPETLEPLLSILAFVAVRILQLRSSLLMEQDGSCNNVLPRHYWQSLWVLKNKKKPIPKKPPTLAWAADTLGRLGGWSRTKRTPYPGWQSLWAGWALLEPHAQGWLAAQEAAKAGEI